MSNLRKILTNKNSCKSVWFMRQAGRYLPEFRKVRSQNQDFIKLCLNSNLSSEITLQPIKRFDLDSAIIFSDILMTPYALGQDVKFIKGEGPQLEKFNPEKFFDFNEVEFSNNLQPVYKAIGLTRKKLNKDKSLICFIGAPWTLLVYMFGNKKNKTELNIKKLQNSNLELEKIFDKLIHFLNIHIENQINSGADVVQIFDSWAGLIPNNKLKEYCIVPNAKIVEFCQRKKIVNICFPKGIKEKYEEFNKIVRPNGINIDQDLNPTWARKKLKDVVIQGGLDPQILLKSESEILQGATKYIKSFEDIPYVFNLGHGLLPETDPDKVKRLVEFYRNF